MRHDDLRIELFIFPDGTRVEMIVFDSAARGAVASTTPASSGRATAGQTRPASAPCRVPPPPLREHPGAHQCPVCRSPLVYPVDWERTGPAVWRLLLRCPECETRREVTLGRASVEELNRELYQGAREIARAADDMTRHNFEDEVERIVAALERDLILPMDF